MFRKGRRLFSVAAISIVVIAALHTIGHFAGVPEPGSELAKVEALMHATKLDLGAGMSPSLGDIFAALSLFMTIALVGFASMMLAVASAGSAKVVRAATVVATVINGAMVVVFGVYQILPPFVMLFITELILVAAIAAGTPDDIEGSTP